MENSAKIKELMQRAVDILYKSEKIEEKGAELAQRIGLQGEKRRLRYESVKSHNLVNYLITDTYDVLGVNLERVLPDIEVPANLVYKNFFEWYLDKMVEEYEALHTLANGLVVNNYKYGACKLYQVCECLIEDIKYYRRTITEGNSCDWDPRWLYIHQTTDENVHDHYESKEDKVGYPH